jgi:ferrochelatase
VPTDDEERVARQRTGDLLREALGLSNEQFLVTFQSRSGFAKWLTPYTEATVKRLAREGIRRIAVVALGFPKDCIETIDEIARENAEYFLNAGGERFEFVRGLNDSEGGIRVIENVVWRELRGWVQR